MARQITISSTTDTQEAINEAAGIKTAEQPPEEKPAAQEEKPAAEETAEKPTAEKPAAEKPTAEKPEGEQAAAEGGGFTKRINKLTAKNYALGNENQTLKEQNDELKKRLDAIEQKVASKAAPEQAQPDPKPVVGQYEKYEDYVDALTDWKIREARKTLQADTAASIKQQQEQQTQQTEQERLRTVYDSYNRRVSETRGRIDDFDEVVGAATDVQIPEAAEHAILEADNGPDIVYYLAAHPDVAKQMSTMSPIKAAAFIGKLSAKLEVNGTQAATEEKPAKAKPVSAAPAPIKPVSSGSAKTEVPIDELPYAEYKAAREKQIRR